MTRAIAMILAGGRVDELGSLTLRRPKSAVPFGGLYRIIDFPLTNLMRSNIDQIGILSQYRLNPLIDHIGQGAPWDLQGRRRGVKILPPFQQAAGRASWYKGTADAVHRNVHFIQSHQPDTVMILSGDHVYRMDYEPLLRLHREKDADLTMVFREVDPESASRFGVATMEADGRITSYEEKPKKPRSNLASLTIYVFKASVLIERLAENARRRRSAPHFHSEIIPQMVDDARVYGYVFDGYWQYSRTLDEYYQANMDLVADPSPIDLEGWRIRTNEANHRLGDAAPAQFGRSAKASSSMIPGGCRIDGEVVGSVLSPWVQVEKGARVENSILLEDVVVEAGAHVKNSILDKHCRVGKNAVVGVGNKKTPNKGMPHSLASGVTVIGRAVQLPAGIHIGTNCEIFPDRLSARRTRIPDGSTVK